jgi:hypothetical protein
MYFFVKALNPRPTFHLDMTSEERATMEKHVAYWSEKARQGIAIVFGPVMDPQGVFGMGVYQAQDEALWYAAVLWILVVIVAARYGKRLTR